MTSKLDLSLDDIIKSRPRFSNRNYGRRQDSHNRNDRRNFGGNNRQTPYSRGSGSPRRGNSGLHNDDGTILVNNLHFNVSEGDLKELFGQVGHVRSASLNFDSRGASNGSGVIIFSRSNDAMAAVKKYNGVTLDGRAMRIAIPVTPNTSSKPVNSRVGPSNPVRENRGSGRQNNHRFNGRNNRRRSSPRPVKTADDLDAELDAYNASNQVETGVASSSIAPAGEAMEE